MPTNLPAEARAKWVKVMEAKTPEEKLRALEEFLSLIPKHKGTEKLRAHVKRQMVRLREEIERKQRKQSRRREGELVAKEGDIQAVLIGYPNTGKSLFTSLLTNVKAISTPTPFETRKPQPAMLFCNGISVQLVDTPSLVEGGGRINSVVFTLARNADVILLFIDALIDPLAQLKKLVQELEGARIKVGRFEGLVRVKKKATGGIEIKGEVQRFSKADVEKFLKSYGIYHAEVEVEGEVKLEDIEKAIFGEVVYKPAILILFSSFPTAVGHGALENLTKYIDLPWVYFTASGFDIESFKREFVKLLMRTLDLIRIYTRKRGTKQISEKPLVIKRGTTVIEVARMIHSQLYKNFKYARIWNDKRPQSPLKVGRNFVLEEGDIVEIVAS